MYHVTLIVRITVFSDFTLQTEQFPEMYMIEKDLHLVIAILAISFALVITILLGVVVVTCRYFRYVMMFLSRTEFLYFATNFNELPTLVLSIDDQLSRNTMGPCTCFTTKTVLLMNKTSKFRIYNENSVINYRFIVKWIKACTKICLNFLKSLEYSFNKLGFLKMLGKVWNVATCF